MREKLFLFYLLSSDVVVTHQDMLVAQCLVHFASYFGATNSRCMPMVALDMEHLDGCMYCDPQQPHMLLWSMSCGCKLQQDLFQLQAFAM